ncbi:MAG: hypothetical protein A2583_13560 [Bdellovibrionales bacterium RIFOXYD1_FULL_53_11]|nr:MAG: hypothetical protein A2583_13560 [Bdellovibrionales bacterium RIFOXYD1_FULL_53_11]
MKMLISFVVIVVFSLNNLAFAANPGGYLPATRVVERILKHRMNSWVGSLSDAELDGHRADILSELSRAKSIIEKTGEKQLAENIAIKSEQIRNGDGSRETRDIVNRLSEVDLMRIAQDIDEEAVLVADNSRDAVFFALLSEYRTIKNIAADKLSKLTKKEILEKIDVAAEAIKSKSSTEFLKGVMVWGGIAIIILGAILLCLSIIVGLAIIGTGLTSLSAGLIWTVVENY